MTSISLALDKMSGGFLHALNNLTAPLNFCKGNIYNAIGVKVLRV